MTGWLPGAAEEVFGTGASAEEAYGLLTVDVPADTWTASLDTARRVLGCTYFDWLSAVDEPGTGFRVCAHVVALAPVRRLLLRTTVPHETPALASAVGVYAGAAWHERETHEMFGLRFEGHPGLTPLLLPETFEGHPLRKDFVLAARVAKAWPGAKEPGESGHGTPKRRQMLPPGVPDPNEWGPLKGQLPEAPARPARRTRTAGGAAAGTGEGGGYGSGCRTGYGGDAGRGRGGRRPGPPQPLGLGRVGIAARGAGRRPGPPLAYGLGGFGDAADGAGPRPRAPLPYRLRGLRDAAPRDHRGRRDPGGQPRRPLAPRPPGLRGHAAERGGGGGAGETSYRHPWRRGRYPWRRGGHPWCRGPCRSGCRVTCREISG
ncbi:NADH-quinone oxidoreductase subunit C [Streptomyces sp. SA3_actG]|uniref:NADH-quinone oxidoreductase subunit C n=1 Tax=Streptomyces sp. SA3_actG TaxID=683219 RepID=UPI000200087A